MLFLLVWASRLIPVFSITNISNTQLLIVPLESVSYFTRPRKICLLWHFKRYTIPSVLQHYYFLILFFHPSSLYFVLSPSPNHLQPVDHFPTQPYPGTFVLSLCLTSSSLAHCFLHFIIVNHPQREGESGKRKLEGKNASTRWKYQLRIKIISGYISVTYEVRSIIGHY